MKLIIVGGPVEGKVKVDVAPGALFGDIFLMIQEALGIESIWDKFQLHTVEMNDRRVKPTAHVIQPDETPETLGLSPSRSVVMLQSTCRRVSPRPMSGDVDPITSPVSPQGDYRSRLAAIYRKYNPTKLSTVDATLRKFRGKEEAVIRQLVKKYGPEPVDSGTETAFNCSRDAPVASSIEGPTVCAAEEGDNGNSKDIVFAHGGNESGNAQSDGFSAVLNGVQPLDSEAYSKPCTNPIDAVAVSVTDGRPQMESYNYQKFHSPLNHKPLEEPLSETDENPVDDRNEPSLEGFGAKMHVMPTGIARQVIATTTATNTNTNTAAAAPLLKQGNLDAVKPFGHDFETPVMKVSCPTCVFRDGRGSLVSGPDVERLVARAMAPLRDAAANTVRQAYWKKWQYKLAERVASELIGSKVWTRGHDGVRLNDDIPHPYVVPNLSDYIFKRRFRGGRAIVDFSDDLQKALRELLYTVKLVCADALGAEGSLYFPDDELCPVRDTKRLAAALRMVAEMIKDHSKLREHAHSQQRELALSHGVYDALQEKLAKAESFVDRFTESQTELANSQANCAKLEDKLKRVEQELTGVRYKVHFLQRELKNGRSRSPTKIDAVSRPKEVVVSSLQQELAKVRTRLHRERKEREALESQLTEARLREVHAAPKPQLRLQGNPPPASPVGRDRPMDTTTLLLNRAQGSFSPARLGQTRIAGGGMIRDEDFEPEPRPGQDAQQENVNEKTNIDLARENLRLEAELRNPHAVLEVDFGSCPHCMMCLTSCSAMRTGPPEGKAAFCFSCRRSYTFSELETREKYIVAQGPRRVGENGLSTHRGAPNAVGVREMGKKD